MFFFKRKVFVEFFCRWGGVEGGSIVGGVSGRGVVLFFFRE